MLEEFSNWTRKSRPVGLAQPCRRLDQRIEHRLKIERRAADDLKHIGCGGLLLERLTQFILQPNVLDRGDGLGREILHQSYLLFRGRPHLLPVNADDASQTLFLYRREAEKHS